MRHGHDRETIIRAYDAFDLPDWLGTARVRWEPLGAIREAALVRGELCGDAGERVALDLLAVDAAYPEVVCPEQARHDAHQAWHFGQVALVEDDGRVAVTAPGTNFDAELVCEVVRRLAKSVGAPVGNYTVSFTL